MLVLTRSVVLSVPLDDPDHVSMVEFLAGGGSGGLDGQVGKRQIKAESKRRKNVDNMIRELDK